MRRSLLVGLFAVLALTARASADEAHPVEALAQAAVDTVPDEATVVGIQRALTERVSPQALETIKDKARKFFAAKQPRLDFPDGSYAVDVSYDGVRRVDVHEAATNPGDNVFHVLHLRGGEIHHVDSFVHLKIGQLRLHGKRIRFGFFAAGDEHKMSSRRYDYEVLPGKKPVLIGVGTSLFDMKSMVSITTTRRGSWVERPERLEKPHQHALPARIYGLRLRR